MWKNVTVSRILRLKEEKPVVFPPSWGWKRPLVVDKKGGNVYLEQVAAQNLQPLLGIFHAVQLWILIQHALENVEEKLQRELVQEMHLEEENRLLSNLLIPFGNI